MKEHLKLRKFKSKLSRWATKTPLQYFPVVVRSGIARGAWWTMLPHSAYWRGTFEVEIQKVLELCGCRKGGCFWDIGVCVFTKKIFFRRR